ncbi:hypothetical protein INS49_002720 [Diaporthe citri]|uniref:uncharacterized protein n=1 Tax=Diaporthe citri TaxID=83186 RepID=UPI001C807C69|nr:uncharacterized protein INS49_002720 [Diaporthe citri]KAG6368510.1 hypothetical protein INS49_002720 [Diaporthe citri]
MLNHNLTVSATRVAYVSLTDEFLLGYACTRRCVLRFAYAAFAVLEMKNVSTIL